MAFRGWPAEALDFYEGLEADNTKTYWNEHKAFYDESVKGPVVELLAELAPVYGEGKVFRPYRDVRFSADKTPYKTHLGAMVGDCGYVQLSAEGLAAGRGYYGLAKDQLDRYRRAVAGDATGGALESVVADLEGAGYGVTAHGELKTAPRGYPKDHPRIGLLRKKGLAAWKQWPAAAWLGTAKAKDRLVAFYEAAEPLQDWLDTHVGPSELEDPRRR
ncbi:MAG: DUF2461 domain-containing protein [Acidimicrobiales bacterium]|nr:DUF2461 domain-containing protein [Acidimicrobiales bacterium]